MPKAYFYVNLPQTMAVIGGFILGWKALDIIGNSSEEEKAHMVDTAASVARRFILWR